MQNMGGEGDQCPFVFNFDPDTFTVGDMVSYRVSGSLDGFPFVGTLAAVHDDHVMIAAGDPAAPDALYRGTRESRPLVDAAEI